VVLVNAPVAVKRQHDLRNAWISLVFIPVSLVLADGVLHGLLSLFGIDEEADEYPSLWQALLAGIPYAAVMLAPTVGAFWFGTNAIRAGDWRGRVPSLVAVAWAALVVVGCSVFLVLTLRHAA
jgi:hypothetical protein